MIAPVLIWLILCEHKQLLFIFICTGNHPFYGYHLLQVDRYLFIGISSSLSQPRSPMLYIYISTSAKQAWQTHTAKGQPHLRHICIHVSLFRAGLRKSSWHVGRRHRALVHEWDTKRERGRLRRDAENGSSEDAFQLSGECPSFRQRGWVHGLWNPPMAKGSLQWI